MFSYDLFFWKKLYYYACYLSYIVFSTVWKRGANNVLSIFKKQLFFCIKLIFFLVFLDYFDVLISKIILKNKKIYYFDTFPNEKHLKNNRNHTLKHSLHLH